MERVLSVRMTVDLQSRRSRPRASRVACSHIDVESASEPEASLSAVERQLRIAVIGDVHANFELLDVVLARVARADVDGVLLVGDLGSHALSYVSRRTPERDALYLRSVEEVLARARAVHPRVLYVPGNHDLPELDFEGNADRRVLDLAGVRVGGIGGAGPGKFGFAYEWNEDDVRARPRLACDLVLSHTPPARTPLDLLHDGRTHVGSEAIRELALAHAGVLVCGHIHEAPGVWRLGDCLCLNAGGLGAPFAKPQVGFVRRRGSAWSVHHERLDARGELIASVDLA